MVPMRAIALLMEGIQCNINYGNMRAWSAFELSWMTRFYHYHGSGSNEGTDFTASLDLHDGDRSSLVPKPKVCVFLFSCADQSSFSNLAFLFQQQRWSYLEARVSGQVFDLFVISRIHDVYFLNDFSQVFGTFHDFFFCETVLKRIDLQFSDSLRLLSRTSRHSSI